MTSISHAAYGTMLTASAAALALDARPSGSVSDIWSAEYLPN